MLNRSPRPDPAKFDSAYKPQQSPPKGRHKEQKEEHNMRTPIPREVDDFLFVLGTYEEGDLHASIQISPRFPEAV